MKIKNIKKLKSKYKIEFEDREPIFISENTLLKNNIIKKINIDEKKISDILLDESKEQAFKSGLNYLSYGMRTELEMIKYLRKKNISEDNISYSIKRLKDSGYLNDSNYSKTFIEEYFCFRKKGPNYIKMKLKNKGVFKEYVDDFIDEICTYEKQIKNIIEQIEKNYRSKEIPNNKKIQKIKHKLYLDGYSFDKINYAFNSIENELKNLNCDKYIIEKYYNKAYNKFCNKYHDKRILKQKLVEKLLRDGFSYGEIQDYFLNIQV